jgi:pimeloyl-ACP methyl ester carboxylesterase
MKNRGAEVKLDEKSSGTLWETLGQAAVATGRVVGVGAVSVGRSALWSFRAVDPDLRRQLFQAPVLGLMGLTGSKSPDDSLAHDMELAQNRALLLIHGLGGSPSNFWAMGRYFAHVAGRKGRTIDLRGAACLDEMAERLRRRIEEICNGEGSPKVDLITHSMGGIVARIALEDEATRARVATLVTMATPHTGTHLARLATTPRTLDLRPDSSVIQRLAAQTFWEDSTGPRLIALWSHADTTILPPESAAWSAAETHHLEGFTHFSYLLSPRSWQLLTRLLQTGR